VNDRRLDALRSFEEGRSAHRAGDLPGAARYYRCTLALAPEMLDAEHLLAISWLQQGGAERSARRLRSLLGRHPDPAGVAVTLGHAEAASGRAAAANAAFRSAIAIAPDAAQAWLMLGNRAAASGRYAGAALWFARAAALDPLDPAALGNVGSALAELKAPAASRWHARAAAVGPGAAEAWINVGHGARGQGRWRKAGAAYRRAHAIDGDALALSEAVHASLQLASWRHLPRDVERLARLIEDGRPVPPFHLLALDLPATLKRRNAERWCQRHAPAPRRRPERPPGLPLRLGYLSGDFRRHAVGYQIVGLIEAHDRSRIELFGYGWAPDDGSAIRARLERAFGGLVDLAPLSDAEAALRIEADRLDVLIDLAGHTHGARPGILARRPAGVQAAYFGFPGSTGAAYHDYALMDAVTAPAGAEAEFSEALVRLPGCFFAADPASRPGRRPSRAGLGLAEDAVVLACFNQVYKLQPAIFGLWMRVLAAAPAALLWLIDPGLEARANLAREAAAAGVDPARLVFAPPLPHAAHLERCQAADLAIDTLPYGSHVTGADALSMGCPLVTRLGSDFAGRVGASLLRAVGLDELVAGDDAAYVALAVELARDGARRAGLGRRLAERRRSGPLLDMERLGGAVEDAAEAMRRQWHRGRPPEGFAVTRRGG
jgi:predicted O-linked N-acetylglucosamine transferase (SPINDLY family)